MKNKYEGFCYVCGEVVPEEQGIAEQRERKSGEAGWGKTTWSVRHANCKPEDADRKGAEEGDKQMDS